ncbi:MAG: hypothetical protein PHW04_06555 [Candidatus Wallbacteria bacterium]|nr:hypothetical protein [Candidatus Wallbacteria bacterium]
MKPVCQAYVKNIRLIGALMSIIPTVATSIYILFNCRFRPVYLLRLLLSLGFGGLAGAMSNEMAVKAWLKLIKEKNLEKAVKQGAVGGLLAGITTAIVPPLTGFISSSNPDKANKILVSSVFSGAVIGTLFGSFLGYMGFKYMLDDSEE